MVVSQGFYRKIKEWIYSEHYRGVRFRPFQTNGNPYKAKCFLVGAYADTVLTVNGDESTLFAEALMNSGLFKYLYGDKCDSKEVRGIERFIDWYSAIDDSPVVVTNMNCLQVNGLPALRLAKKEYPKDFAKGASIFNQVMLEFLPQCLIVHGNEALKMFRKQYGHIMIDYYQDITKAKDLEDVGPFAILNLATGHRIHVFACRHMSNYTENALQTLKKNIKNTVKSER